MSYNIIPRVRNQIFKNTLARNLSSSSIRCTNKDTEVNPNVKTPSASKRSEISLDLFEDVPDTETHTGQKFEVGDKRRVRFVSYQKYVNPNIARELISRVPPIASKDRVVWCDGGDPHLGHPKVYINLDKPGNHTCGYCGLRFNKKDEHDH